MSIFGPLIDSADAEAAMIAFLREWIPTGVGYALRVKDPDGEIWPEGVAAIREIRASHLVADRWPEDQLPMLLISSPGETKDPVVAEDGRVTRYYGLVVGAIASGVNEADAKALARLYNSAAGLMIGQSPHLPSKALHPDGFADGLSLGPTSNSQITKGVDAERNLMGVWTPFEVQVDNTMQIDKGVSAPLDDPSVEPEDRPVVKKGGAEVAVELREAGFFS